jgi:Alr-MurF fusion protein
MINFSQLEAITQGKILSFTKDFFLTNLIIDSRKVTSQSGAVFFAIRGERHDGHHYLRAAYDLGVRQFVVETAPDISTLGDSNVLQVSSSVDALQKIAAHHRSGFSFPVVGVTGSNGKTIIKEWLYQILSKELSVVKNPGSYNSQVGVPLSVWQMHDFHQFGIFEAGISKPGEMKKLAQVIQPTIGIFSNIGSAHDEGFSNRKEKILEKLKLFENAGVLIYSKDDADIDEAVASSGIKKTFTWGIHPKSDVNIKLSEGVYHIACPKINFDIRLPFADKASIQNACHVVVVLLWLGYEATKIQQWIASLQSVPMRLELKNGINQCQIIDDTYNNDMGGLEISLQFLAHQHQKQKKTIILSDVLQSGLTDEELAKDISNLLKQNGVHKLIGIGPVLSRYHHFFPAGSSFFETTDQFLTAYDTDLFQQEIILIKGARSFQFEKIAARLQQKVHGTVMEIDLGALIYNLNYFKSLLKPSTKVMVMVKAFAYGSGSAEIANLLQYHRADYLGVAYADEGIELRRNNSTLPIMVMNPTAESFDQMRKYNLEPEIYNFKIFHELIAHLRGAPLKIHLKTDTGMHRLGFEDEDLEAVIRLLQESPNLEVASIFSHLAGADEAQHDPFSREQASRFKIWADRVTAAIGYKPLYHIVNSPGILRLTDLQFDMVRLGIGLYGVDPTAEGHPLKPVATLKTIISQIRKVKKGETVGYGRRGVAEADMQLATIAIGYADGFTRAFSRGVGVVLVHGKRAPVFGNVCMDMVMVDITDILAKEGDEVIIFGPGLPIEEVAARVNTIPYEILTNTSERVKRVFVAEGI